MKILICNDGSEQAEKAMRLGAAIAAGCKADVALFGIIEAPGKSQAILDALKPGQALLEDKGIHAELITKSGEPIPEIIKRTEEAQYDLVVIGAVRKSTRGLFWMSSKAYKIIKEVEPPVLTVLGNGTGIKRILMCSGGRRHSDAAMRLLGEIARGAGAAVTLFHVMPELPAIYTGLPRMEETVAWLLDSQCELGLNLRREKEILESSGVTTEVRGRRGPVLEEILGETHEGSYDLIVTGSSLSSGLRSYILGDITREIVNRIDCPVLVVRGPQKPADFRGGLRALFGRFARERGT